MLKATRRLSGRAPNYVIRLSAHKLLPDTEDPGDQRADRENFEVAQWLQRHIRRVRRHERCIKFRELRRILSTYHVSLGTPWGNRIDIQRGHLRTQVFYGDEGRDVEPNTVHKIRRDLELDEEHGYDSDIFYNAGPRINGFIQAHRRILQQLAKL